MTIFNAYLGAYWTGRELTFGQFVESVRQFTLGLSRIDASFEHLWVLGDKPNEEIAVEGDLANLEALTLARGWDRSTPAAWITRLSDGGEPSWDSISRTGWSLALVTAPEATKDPQYSYIQIFAGGPAQSSVNIKTRDKSSSLLLPRTAASLLRYVVEFWHPDRAVFTEKAFRNAVKDPGSSEQLGWLNYRSNVIAPRLNKVLPAAVEREEFADGLLFRIGNGAPLTARDQAEVAQGLEIQAALRAS